MVLPALPKNLQKSFFPPRPLLPLPSHRFPPSSNPLSSPTSLPFDSLSAATIEAGTSLDLTTLLRSFCDASALTPPPLPSPFQRSSQKEETLRPGPFSPRPPSPPPIFQSPILSDAFATFDSLSHDSPLPCFLFPHFAHTLMAMLAIGSEDAAHPCPIILAHYFQPSMITSSLPSPPPPFPLFLFHALYLLLSLFTNERLQAIRHPRSPSLMSPPFPSAHLPAQLFR